MTSVSAFFSEFLATAILLIVVFAMCDKKNTPPPNGTAPILLFLLILGIGACLGMETGQAFSPMWTYSMDVTNYLNRLCY